MYRISDFREEFKNKHLDFARNHFLILCFAFFMVFVGAFGIWLKPVFIDDCFSWLNFLDSFNSLNLLGYSLPLIVLLSFDKAVYLIRNSILDRTVTMWFLILYIIAVVVIFFLFALGFRIGGIEKFSYASFIAWLLVLYLWVLCNVSNPHYQKPTKENAATGGSDVSRTALEG